MDALTRGVVGGHGNAQAVSAARLRIAQVALFGAMDANRDLLVSEAWQDALIHVNRMISEAQPKEDENQLVLFPNQKKKAAS